MSKYTPMKHYLAGLPDNTQEITLSFNQIERILDAKLPSSAHRHQAWWSNEQDGRHVQAHSWMNAGWLVDTFNQKEKWVRFRRM